MEENQMKERSTRSLNFGAYHDLNTVCCSREKKTWLDPVNFVCSYVCFNVRTASMQIYSWMDTLVADYPNLITKQHIGVSYENRPMYVLKVRYSGYASQNAAALHFWAL